MRALRYALIAIQITIFSFGMGVAAGFVPNPLPPMLFEDSYVLAACWIASEVVASLYRSLEPEHV